MDWDYISREIRPLLDRAESFDSFLSVLTRNIKDRPTNTKGVSRLPFLEAVNYEKLAQTPPTKESNVLYDVMHESCVNLPRSVNNITDIFNEAFNNGHKEALLRLKKLKEDYAAIKRQQTPLIQTYKKKDEALTKFTDARDEQKRKPDSKKKQQNLETAEAEAYFEVQQHEALLDDFLTDLKSFVANEYREAEFFVVNVVEAHRLHLEELTKTLTDEIATMNAIMKTNGQRCVFGDALEKHLTATGRRIAVPLESCAGVLRKIGLGVEGLFRIPGAHGKVKGLAAAFDAGVVDWEYAYADVHSVAGVMKKYVRDLPEPLLTFGLHDAFMKIGAELCEKSAAAAAVAAAAKKDGEDAEAAVSAAAEAAAEAENTVVDELSRLVKKLPRANYDNLAFVTQLLLELESRSAQNKMNAFAIATVVGPNVAWPLPPAEMPYAQFSHRNRIVEALIVHFGRCFPDFVYAGEREEPGASVNAPPTPNSTFQWEVATAPTEEERRKLTLQECLFQRERILDMKKSRSLPTKNYEDEKYRGEKPRAQTQMLKKSHEPIKRELMNKEKKGNLNRGSLKYPHPGTPRPGYLDIPKGKVGGGDNGASRGEDGEPTNIQGRARAGSVGVNVVAVAGTKSPISPQRSFSMGEDETLRKNREDLMSRSCYGVGGVHDGDGGGGGNTGGEHGGGGGGGEEESHDGGKNWKSNPLAEE